ncbi:MAG TPA: hypothetical protein VN854_01365 [Mycoplasmatales bacterium]|jgi:hypothetical protein|nr:hypothetical protein [Mycoplasmatales bacterium]
MKNRKILSIDPSGSGTTALYFLNEDNNEEMFRSFNSKHWKDHFLYIKKFCEEEKIDFIIYETTNFIKVKNKDLTSLFKLFGTIETIPYTSKTVKNCETIFVREVKMLQKKIKEGLPESKINLKFIPGRGGGWFRNKQKINIHEADAFIIFYCYHNRIKSTQKG